MSYNATLTFIETDLLEPFLRLGGNRDVRYVLDEQAFRFAYTLDNRWASFLLYDWNMDPSQRENDIMLGEALCMKNLAELAIASNKATTGTNGR